MNGAAYQTYDIVLASYLIASESSRLTDITGNGDGRKLFCFDPAPTKEQLIQFYSGEAHVSARKYAEALASLKGSAYTMRQFT